MPCIISRNPVGTWCGYVGVPPGHPWHGKAYDDVEVNIHGGLTYAQGCGVHICHKPEPGEADDVWWLGFDCAHAGDLCPSMIAMRNIIGLPARIDGVYRDQAYVMRETEYLAQHALKAAL